MHRPQNGNVYFRGVLSLFTVAQCIKCFIYYCSINISPRCLAHDGVTPWLPRGKLFSLESICRLIYIGDGLLHIAINSVSDVRIDNVRCVSFKPERAICLTSSDEFPRTVSDSILSVLAKLSAVEFCITSSAKLHRKTILFNFLFFTRMEKKVDVFISFQ